MAVTIAAIGGLALGAAKFISSSAAQKRDRKAQEALKRPFYKVQDEYFQDRNIAAEMATTGLPIDVTNQLARERSRGLATSLDALKQTAGGANNFAALNKGFDDSLLNQASVTAQQQQKNIEYFMQVNKDLAGQKTTQFGVNELQPYESNLKQSNERLAADEQNKWSGASEAIGSLSAIGTGMQNQKLLNQLFKNQNGTGIEEPYKIAPTDVSSMSPNTSLGIPNVAASAPAANPLTLDLN